MNRFSSFTLSNSSLIMNNDKICSPNLTPLQSSFFWLQLEDISCSLLSDYDPSPQFILYLCQQPRGIVIIFARKSIYIWLKVGRLSSLCFSKGKGAARSKPYCLPRNHSFRHFTKLYRRRSFLCRLFVCCCFCCTSFFSWKKAVREIRKVFFYLNKFSEQTCVATL